MEEQLTPEQRISNLFQSEETPEEAPPQKSESAPSEPTQSAEPPVTEDTEETEISTISELAEALGVEPEALYNIRLPVDIDGQGKEEITLGNYKDMYRDSRVIESKRQELEQKRAEIETLHKQRVEAFEVKEREAAELLGYMEQQVFAQYGNVDWNHLRQADPGQWAALSFQFEQEKRRLAEIRSTAALKWDNARRELREADEARERDLTAHELRQAVELIPEWKNPEMYQRDATKMRAYLMQQGWSHEDINKIRLKDVLLARDAMRYRELQTNTDAAKKKVFKLGKKMLTPGVRQTGGAQSDERATTLGNRLKKTGNMKDAAALIAEKMKG